MRTPIHRIIPVSILAIVFLGAGCGGEDECTSQTYYPDNDSDGFGTDTGAVMACEPPAGFVDKAGDCRDADTASHTGVTEICDQIDNNCDGLIDDADPMVNLTTGTTYYLDADGDGFGDAAMSKRACAKPTGYVESSTDCDDADPAIKPTGLEVCDAVDNDCDALIDDADPTVDTSAGTTYFRDGDGDGFGNAAMSRRACAMPSGHVANSTDCNDANAAIKPTALEVCDAVDNDCDTLVDIADPSLDVSTTQTYFRDMDNDMFGAGAPMVACNQPAGFVLTSGDCNDNDNTSHPGGVEVCDGADNNCDGGIDGTVAAPNQCTALIGTYAGSYNHQATERLGSTVINQMTCAGTGSGSLVLASRPALQGMFTCVYTGGLTIFSTNQRVTISANVALNGAVTGTVEHVYNTFDNLKRTYNVTGTLTPTTLTLTGTGMFLPNPMSVQPWEVTFSFAATK
jgi:hypothetical protein